MLDNSFVRIATSFTQFIKTNRKRKSRVSEQTSTLTHSHYDTAGTYVVVPLSSIILTPLITPIHCCFYYLRGLYVGFNDDHTQWGTHNWHSSLVTAYCVSLETPSSSITNTTASSVHSQLKSLSIEATKISVRIINRTINKILLICVYIYYQYMALMRGSFFHNPLATADTLHLGTPVLSVRFYRGHRTWL